MTFSLNAHRRDLMNKAKNLAVQAQASPAGLTRGHILRLPVEDQLDMLIEILRVCPVEYMEIAAGVELVPCGYRDCDVSMPVSQLRYCSPECRQLESNARQRMRRVAA